MDILEIFLQSSLVLFAFIYFFYFCLMTYETRRPENIRKREILPNVSLVIPAYNEKEFILRCLQNVKNLDFPKDKLQVLVVDDGSTDNTSELTGDFIKKNSGDLDIRLIVEPTRTGKASALNHAWQGCDGEIVMLTDGDAVLKEDAVKKITRNFADPSVGAVTGKLSMFNFGQCNATRIEKTYRNVFDFLRMGESRLDSTPIFNGSIIALRKNLLEELKADSIAEDTELALKIRERGYRTVFDPEAIAYATTPASYKWRIKQKSRRGMGIIQSFMWHKNMIFNPKYQMYGFVILPIEFFMHIISPIMIVFFLTLIPLMMILNFSAVFSFLLILVTAIIALLLVTLASKIFKLHYEMINPLSIFVTFLEHQLALFSSLLYLLRRTKNQKWEKIRC